MWLFHSGNNPCGFFPFNVPPQLGAAKVGSNSSVGHASSWLQPNPGSRMTGWRSEAPRVGELAKKS
jgi:hypothetical protein